MKTSPKVCCELYFRLSSRRSVEAAHPRLGQDLFTSCGAKELVARHLDSYLHCLAAVSGAAGVVTKLRRLQPTVFRHLVALRRPRDELGARWIEQTSIIIATLTTRALLSRSRTQDRKLWMDRFSVLSFYLI